MVDLLQFCVYIWSVELIDRLQLCNLTQKYDAKQLGFIISLLAASPRRELIAKPIPAQRYRASFVLAVPAFQGNNN